MKLEMRGQLRLEQRMKLAPHMIQSMEILQLPILALQERIEQELNSNPVLEIEEPVIQTPEVEVDTKDSAPDTEMEKIEDFGRYENLDDGYKENIENWTPFRRGIRSDEPDPKLEAIKNTAAPSQSLHEFLEDQWRLIEAPEPIKNAGKAIIDYIDDRGYLSVRLEQLHNKDTADFSFDDLQNGLKLVQKLEPIGVGARDLKECLLIQMGQNVNDMSFEARLVTDHMNNLLDNRLPLIAKKMNCSIGDINKAIVRMSKLDTSPGLQIGPDRNHPITSDIIVEPFDESADPIEYIVRLADNNLQNLRINNSYAQMLKDSLAGESTKEFLQKNIRSAQWIIDAVEQRKRTLLKVAGAVVNHQKDFFDQGQLHLKPLPMSKIADEIGVHLSTVSRAVAGKYIQCSWGVIPLRKFFSSGTEDANGHARSWEAVRGELQRIIDAEDKSKPLSDDKILKELAEAGINNLARRTVAKYRKLMNIPAARFRKKY